MILLTNSLTRKKEEFVPFDHPKVGMYTCGMTVYDYSHIGHGRKYVADDLLKRVLKFNGYEVLHVQNVTDVGHLVSDADSGEDKLEKGAKKAGKSVWEVAEFFTNHFYKSMDKLNILRPDIICKATDHIPEQIELVKKLMDKGFAYDTPEAVYFSISKFENYDGLFGQKREDKKVAVRDSVKEGEHKKNPQDFALWFKRVGRFENHTMHWDSPWGDGFPGWHIECSAMSMRYLGDQFDIHTGGIEHTMVHHPNEIAQSESATGKHPFAKYWIHAGHLMVEGQKMSKSLNNFYKIEDIEEKGFEVLALRYLFLNTHYRDPLNFTWKSLEGAQTTLNRLREQVLAAKVQTGRTALSLEKNEKVESFSKEFKEAVNDDLNTAKALAVLWSALKSNIPSEDKYDLAINFDEVLGFNLRSLTPQNADKIIQTPDGNKVITPRPLSKETMSRIDARELARSKGDYSLADEIRGEIEKTDGINLVDTNEGLKVK